MRAMMTPVAANVAVAIIVITIILIGDIAIQAFLPLSDCRAPPVHLRLLMCRGSIIAIAQIIAEFLPVVMELFPAILDSLSIGLHILP
jgi:hypothetical protein